jgi:hypothetical protein
MKKYKYIWFAPAFGAVVMMFAAFSGNGDYPSGAPAGYTGSPSDGKNCTQCHGGTASNVTGWITSNIPTEGYTPGNTYNITVTVTGSGAKGFEVSPQDLAGNLLGTLAAGTGCQLTGSGKYITHTGAMNGNPSMWTFPWTAPVSGTGDVTFYGAFAVSKNTTKLSTLTVSEHTIGVGIDPHGASGTSVTASPNPSSGKFNLSFGDRMDVPVTFRVYNLSGKTELIRTAEPAEINGNYSIDLAGRPAGLYFMEVSSGNFRQVIRLIKSED